MYILKFITISTAYIFKRNVKVFLWSLDEFNWIIGFHEILGAYCLNLYFIYIYFIQLISSILSLHSKNYLQINLTIQDKSEYYIILMTYHTLYVINLDIIW